MNDYYLMIKLAYLKMPIC